MSSTLNAFLVHASFFTSPVLGSGEQYFVIPNLEAQSVVELDSVVRAIAGNRVAEVIENPKIERVNATQTKFECKYRDPSRDRNQVSARLDNRNRGNLLELDGVEYHQEFQRVVLRALFDGEDVTAPVFGSIQELADFYKK